jgi:hypothetical protein
MDKETKRYLELVRRIRGGDKTTSPEDLAFFATYTAEMDKAKLDKLVESGDWVNPKDMQGAIQEAVVAIQNSPEYKEKILKASSDAKGKEVSDRLTQGINLVLGANYIAQSVKQINESKSQLAKSKRPSRPVVPQRDLYLQQALRGAQEGGQDAAKALAPVQAQIQDQYLTDQANATTASTGQAGAYGSYSQLAANRRNRAAMNLAPIQDEIRRGQQGRYDQLLGMRLDETQNIFQNQASLYPTELQQYQYEQNAAGSLGAQGRENLNASLYGMASQIPNMVGNEYSKRKYQNLLNQMNMYGEESANIAVKNQQYLDEQIAPRRMRFGNFGATEQMYNTY